MHNAKPKWEGLLGGSWSPLCPVNQFALPRHSGEHKDGNSERLLGELGDLEALEDDVDLDMELVDVNIQMEVSRDQEAVWQNASRKPGHLHAQTQRVLVPPFEVSPTALCIRSGSAPSIFMLPSIPATLRGKPSTPVKKREPSSGGHTGLLRLYASATRLDARRCPVDSEEDTSPDSGEYQMKLASLLKLATGTEISPSPAKVGGRLLCDWTGCHQSFTKYSQLVRHRRSHTGERPFVCPESGFPASLIWISTPLPNTFLPRQASRRGSYDFASF